MVMSDEERRAAWTPREKDPDGFPAVNPGRHYGGLPPARRQSTGVWLRNLPSGSRPQAQMSEYEQPLAASNLFHVRMEEVEKVSTGPAARNERRATD